MYWVRRWQNLAQSPHGNVVELWPYQHKAARQRRWARWSALVRRAGPADAAQAKRMPVASSGAVLRFRRQAGAARW